MRRVILFAALFGLLCVASHVAASDVEYDEDEFELPVATPEPIADENDFEDETLEVDDEEPASTLKLDEETLSDAMSDEGTGVGAMFMKNTLYLEIVAGAVLVLYMILYFVGSSTNSKTAAAWTNVAHAIFEQQFAKVGFGGTDGLEKESPSDFSFYCTGRRHCKGAAVELTLKKRQDLMSIIQAVAMGQPELDVMTIDIPMDEANMPSFVFAVMPRKDAKNLRSNARDLQDYSKAVTCRGLPDDLVVYTDCPELVPTLLHEDACAIIRDQPELFRIMHFTDQARMTTLNSRLSDKVLRFQFALPAADKMQEIEPLLQLALHYIDRVASVRLSKEAVAHAVKLRREHERQLQKELHQQRQEESAERKEKKLIAEREKARRRGEEAKFDAKQQRRAMKRRGKGQMMTVMK